jgi:hypothetical protein
MFQQLCEYSTTLEVKNDFCRMVINKANPDIMFFACALAGTENLSSTEFRTPSTKDLFESQSR